MAIPKKTRKMPASVKSDLKVRKTRAKRTPVMPETASQEARRRFQATTQVAPGIVSVELPPLALNVVVGDEIDVAALFESPATQDRFNRLVTDIVDEAQAVKEAQATDVAMVNSFAGAMHQRMAEKRAEGKGKWKQPALAEHLARRFLSHLFGDGNLIDMGNYLGMLDALPSGVGRHALKSVAKTDLDAKLSEVVKHNAELRQVAANAQKETVVVRAELQRTQSNLSRALGYIDAATEAPRTAATPYREERHRVGELEHVLVQGELRGPKLDTGFHCIDADEARHVAERTLRRNF